MKDDHDFPEGRFLTASLAGVSLATLALLLYLCVSQSRQRRGGDRPQQQTSVEDGRQGKVLQNSRYASSDQDIRAPPVQVASTNSADATAAVSTATPSSTSHPTREVTLRDDRGGSAITTAKPPATSNTEAALDVTHTHNQLSAVSDGRANTSSQDMTLHEQHQSITLFHGKGQADFQATSPSIPAEQTSTTAEAQTAAAAELNPRVPPTEDTPGYPGTRGSSLGPEVKSSDPSQSLSPSQACAISSGDGGTPSIIQRRILGSPTQSPKRTPQVPQRKVATPTPQGTPTRSRPSAASKAYESTWAYFPVVMATSASTGSPTAVTTATPCSASPRSLAVADRERRQADEAVDDDDDDDDYDDPATIESLKLNCMTAAAVTARTDHGHQTPVPLRGTVAGATNANQPTSTWPATNTSTNTGNRSSTLPAKMSATVVQKSLKGSRPAPTALASPALLQATLPGFFRGEDGGDDNSDNDEDEHPAAAAAEGGDDSDGSAYSRAETVERARSPTDPGLVYFEVTDGKNVKCHVQPASTPPGQGGAAAAVTAGTAVAVAATSAYMYVQVDGHSSEEEGPSRPRAHSTEPYRVAPVEINAGRASARPADRGGGVSSTLPHGRSLDESAPVPDLPCRDFVALSGSLPGGPRGVPAAERSTHEQVVTLKPGSVPERSVPADMMTLSDAYQWRHEFLPPLADT